MIPPPESYEGDSPALQYRSTYRRAVDRLDRLRYSNSSIAEIDAERERMQAELGPDAPEWIREAIEDALAGRNPQW